MTRIPLVAIATFILIALPYPAMAESANPMRGERVYRACVACHSLEPNRKSVRAAVTGAAGRCAAARPRTASRSLMVDHPVFPELAGNFSSMSPRGFEAPPSASLNVLPFVT